MVDIMAVIVSVAISVVCIIGYIAYNAEPPPPLILPTDVPIGTMVPYGGNDIPPGWIACDSKSYPTTTYPLLYKAIGYTYGMDGTKYRVPDTRGVFMRGIDATAIRDTNRPAGSIQLSTYDSVSTASYIMAVNTSAPGIKTNVLNTPMPFDTIQAQAGPAISLDGAGKMFSLQPGYTYKCMAGIGYIDRGNVEVIYRWYNNTTGQYVGGAGDMISNGAGRAPMAIAYVVAAVPTTLSLNLMYTSDAGVNIVTNDIPWARIPWASIEAISNNTAIAPFLGATQNTPGIQGYIPSPPAGAQTQFLRGDGTWANPPATIIQTSITTTGGSNSAVARGGFIMGACVVAGGKGYVKPTIVFAPPPTTPNGAYFGIATRAATGAVSVYQGAIVGITILDQGWGYTQAAYQWFNGCYTFVQYTITDAAGTGAQLLVYNVVSGLETEMNNGSGCGGDQSICYVMQDGTLMACGLNNQQHLGLGDVDWTPFPLPVIWYETPSAAQVYNDPTYYHSNQYNATSQTVVAVYTSHACNTYALTTSGYLYVAGNGMLGSLGLGNANTGQRGAFMRISTLPNVVKFGCSGCWNNQHITCVALTAQGVAYGWGYNGYGQLGQGHTTNQTLPVVLKYNINTTIPMVYDVVIIGGNAEISIFLICDSGANKNCVLSAGANQSGQLGIGNGNGTGNGGFQYVYIGSSQILSNVVKIVGGAAGDCTSIIFMRDDGSVYTCGRGANGQIGNGQMNNAVWATPVSNANGFTGSAINIYSMGTRWADSSTSMCFIIDKNGSLLGWGMNQAGELGILSNKALSNVNSPAWVNIPTYSWVVGGQPTILPNGLSTVQYGPIQKITLHLHNAANYGGVCMLTSDGRLYYSGANTRGCAGLWPAVGTGGYFLRVPLNRYDIVDIKFCGNLTVPDLVVLLSNGDVYTCGYNGLGQLGYGRQGDFSRNQLGKVIF